MGKKKKDKNNNKESAHQNKYENTSNQNKKSK